MSVHDSPWLPEAKKPVEANLIARHKKKAVLPIRAHFLTVVSTRVVDEPAEAKELSVVAHGQ